MGKIFAYIIRLLLACIWIPLAIIIVLLVFIVWAPICYVQHLIEHKRHVRKD